MNARSLSAATADNSPKRISGFDWPLASFFALAYAIAWSTFPVMAYFARQAGVADAVTLMGLAEAMDFESIEGSLPVPSWALYLTTRIADFSFTIAGLVVVAWISGRPGLSALLRRLIHFKVPIRWYLFATIPFVFYGISALLFIFSNDEIGFDPVLSADTLRTILFSAEAGIIVVLLLRGPMGEELGLRGFALTRLQERYSPTRASLVIGVLWAGWHLPVLLGRDPVSIGLYCILVILLSFIFTWLYNGSGGSLVPVLLFHTFQNAEDVFEVALPGLFGTDWETVSSLALLATGLVVCVLIVRSGRRAL